MVDITGQESGGLDRMVRVAFWTCAAVLLLAPAMAMRLGDEVNWTGRDFATAGVLLGTVGILFEATMRTTRSWTCRFAAGFAVAAAFLITWANLAVGMIDEGPNVYNLLFFAVIGVAAAGAAFARRSAGGMAVAMLVAALAHAAVALAGYSTDPVGALFSLAFAGLWLLSAALFRSAARDRRTN